MAPPLRHNRRRTATAEDALISLPPDVLDGILTRLGLRDAVRTSALSRAWRRRWESLPSLDISFPFHDGAAALAAVDAVLLRCPGRVRSFNAHVDGKLAARRAQDWVILLSRRGVESLVLSSPFDRRFPLHSSVFSCDRLTYLDLFSCDVPPLPLDFAGFLHLKNLILDHVWLQEGGEYQLEEIIDNGDNSPLLQFLVFSGVFIAGDDFISWVIRAPNLRHLTISSPDDYGWNLFDLPLLRSVVIDLWKYLNGRDFAKFIGQLVHVRKLHLDLSYESPDGAKILETLPCTFHSLKSLKLYMEFGELPPILSTFCLLRNAPNLEKLKIVNTGNNEQKVEANGSFQIAQWTGGMCTNLQILRMAGVNWLPNEMTFIELILSKASLLRTISISHGGGCLISNENALSELLKFKRASPQAQILFKGKEDGY
uniref:Uncharacterized protein n=1 Tax=Leersia perrieri TaxID=77586 RepID=A0A0D9XE71_9ORYZ